MQTVSLGLLVLPSLQQTGSAHAQVNTSLRQASHIAKHAQRYSALYQLLSKNAITPASICIKIPATLEGLRACVELEKQGVRTLATTVFTVEQGLAAAEAAGCKVSRALRWIEQVLTQLHFVISVRCTLYQCTLGTLLVSWYTGTVQLLR